MAIIRIYLSKQPSPARGTYEIYRDGKPTGELVTNAMIRTFLTPAQYRDFLNGDDIFQVQGETFRTRKHNKSKHKRNGKTTGL